MVALAVPLLGVSPAQADAPTGLAFLPLRGSAGTSVTITGTGFDDGSPVTAVAFHGTKAKFSVGSDMTITATVPARATSGTISVTDAEGTSKTLLRFQVKSGSDLPSLTGFLPVAGEPGDQVTLIGSRLKDATGVAFDGVTATIVPGTDGLTAIVPDGATSGPISVTTPKGFARTVRNFVVKGANGTGTTTRHARTVSLAFHGNRAQGRVKANDGSTGCTANVPVKIQRRSGQGWTTVASVRTASSGQYSRIIRNRHGTYRAVAPKAKMNGGADVCARRSSGLRRS
jgi:hypothetical protein